MQLWKEIISHISSDIDTKRRNKKDYLGVGDLEKLKSVESAINGIISFIKSNYTEVNDLNLMIKKLISKI
jgi:hypothetical protein